MLESKFYDYMNFDSELHSRLNSLYLDFFSETDYVLELAPGRGEFMLRLQERGKRVVGVDMDEGMVAEARSKGLQVILADALAFLRESNDRFDGIFSAHFIEHLSSPQLIELLNLCRKALVKGGILVLVAPNPASLQTQLHEFWRDPTHVRPYNLELLHFLLTDIGFEIIKSGGNPDRVYHPLGSPKFRHREGLPAVPPQRGQQVAGGAAQKRPAPPKGRRQLAGLLKKIGLAPLINLYDRVWLLEQAVVDMYHSNEIYVVGRCPR